MGYKSKLFTEDAFIKWLAKREDYSDYADIIEVEPKECIKNVLDKYLKLEKYNSIWEYPDWREYLYANRREFRFAGLGISNGLDNFIMNALLAFSYHVKPFAYGNKEFMKIGMEIFPDSFVCPICLYGYNTGFSVKYNVVNHSETPFEYEIEEVYFISSSGKKLARDIDLIQEDTLPHILERYTYVTVSDNIQFDTERWFDERWKLGIKIKDKLKEKRYSAIFGIETIKEYSRFGSEEDDEEAADGNVSYSVDWQLESLEIEDLKREKNCDVLVKRISRAKKGEKELGISVKRLGCEVTSGIFKCVKIMGDIYPLRGESFKENFVMTCSVYDESDRKVNSREEVINVLNAFDFVPFSFEFNGLDVAEINKIRISYKRIS